ncbi:MAG: Rab family GTPase [Candidatus Hodarchaeota archaeon]
MMQPKFFVKIPFAGDGGVGKTSIIGRFVDQKFSQSYMMTIGANFQTKIMNIDREEVKVLLWDTAGQQRFTSIRTMYYKGSQGIVLVYDVTRRDSFENLRHWFNEIQNHVPNITYMVIGNKIDLEDQRVVSPGEGRNFATSIGSLYAETSAKTGEGVVEAMTQLVQTIIAKLEPIADKKRPVERKLKTTVHPNLLDANEVLLFELKESRG